MKQKKGDPLKPTTIDLPNLCKITQQTHTVKLPNLCPATNNPISGHIRIAYQPQGKALEIYALQEYINSFVGHETVRDIEYFAQVVAVDCQACLGVTVIVAAVFDLHLGQTVTTEVVCGDTP